MKIKVSNNLIIFVAVLYSFGIFSFSHAAGMTDLLTDQRLVRKQIDCVMDRGVCDAIGNSLKDSLIEVIANDCRNCSPHQMINALKIMEFMEKYHGPEWEDIVMKYQPN